MNDNARASLTTRGSSRIVHYDLRDPTVLIGTQSMLKALRPEGRRR